MKLYLISLAVGMLVGILYGLLNVRSPAPPVIALIGLSGILLGEQLVPLCRHWLANKPVDTALISSHLRAHSFAQMPKQAADCGAAAADARAPGDV